MKIAVLHFGRHGAGPVYSYEMARAISIAGHEVIYYASSSVDNRKIVEKSNLICRFYDTYHSKLTYLASIIFKQKINDVLKDIRREKPEVVYCPMNDLWTPFIFRKLSGTIRVKTIHDVGVHEGNNSIINKIWNNSQFKHAEKYVILSKGFLPVLIKKGINSKDIIVIPHAGFDYYLDTGNKKTFATQKESKILLFFGRIDKYKGLEVLLSAMEIVLIKMPSLKLLIAGNGDIAPYQSLINKLGDSVILKNGWIADEDVASIVSMSSAVVLPYIHATQSGVIPLAYAFSKPVIATNVGCLGEQVLDGETGILVEKNNPRLLSEAILKLYSKPEKMKKMGDYANRYMKENLTWKASARILLDFLNE